MNQDRRNPLCQLCVHKQGACPLCHLLPAWVTIQGARDSERGRALKSSADSQVMVALLLPVTSRRLPKEMLRETKGSWPQLASNQF